MSALEASHLEALARYLAVQFGAQEVAIGAMTRLHGGASRETFAFDARVDGIEQALILRRDPLDSLLVTERALEFSAYRSFAGTAVPVPRAIALEETGEVIGRPFFVMQRLEGGLAASPIAQDPYGIHREAIGRQFFTILGALHRHPVEGSPLAAVTGIPDPVGAAPDALTHWQGVIEREASEPQPIAAAVIRRLRRSLPPPPQRLSIVHGDYRSGNFLHDDAGRILAVLDWEMAHVGDPLEDLAWAMDPLWAHRSERVGAMVPEAEAIALWEAASGLTADRAALEWWRMFASLKGQAIWISGARAFAAGVNPDPVLAFSGWYCLLEHDAIQADRLVAGRA
jgi:aminoglycoside phosphotransferase (APT) family kinase protein